MSRNLNNVFNVLKFHLGDDIYHERNIIHDDTFHVDMEMVHVEKVIAIARHS